MPVLKLVLLTARAVVRAAGQADGTSFVLFAVC